MLAGRDFFSLQYLSSVQAIEKFSANTVRVDGMTEEQYHEQFKADSKSAKKERLDEQQALQQIIMNMEIGKPWGSFRGDISWWANQKKEYLDKFAGKVELDSSSVTRYLNHEYRELMECASSDKPVTKNLMLYLGKELCKRWHIKLGYRIEIWGWFNLNHWVLAVNGPDASFPFLLAEPGKTGLDLEDPKVAKRIVEREGVRVYAR